MAILCYIVITLLFPFYGVIAGTTDSITITTTGTSNATVDSLTDFVVVATDQDDSDDGIDWVDTDGSYTIPSGATGAIVLRKFDSYPSTVSDGVVVYNGANSSFTETIISDDITVVYYSAWAYNGIGNYSDPSHFLLELEANGMTNVMILLVFIILAIAPTIACFAVSNGRTVLSLVASLGWLMLGVFAYTQSDATWDIYYSLGFISLWLVAMFVFIPAAYWYQRRKDEASIFEEENWGADEPLRKALKAEEQDQERMSRLFGRSSKPKKKKDRFTRTGEI